ncbi:MAG: hypothetical protein H8E61_00790 [Bacteroidetes bacterium]|nr:hypothetical protein [Bacteroidota bacterium]
MTTKTKRYNISVSKNDNNIDLVDLNDWIDTMIDKKWSKREFKNKIVYTFNDIDDAFRFKLRWSFG